MGSVITHAFIAGSLGFGMLPRGLRSRVLALGVIGAILPDIDIVAFLFDLPEGHPLGHRGLTHSMAFAALYAVVVVAVAMPSWLESRYRRRIYVFLFLATASHGLLDALTDGKRGIAFFSPLSNARIYSPWQPLPAAPISASRFFGPYGLEVLSHEILWIWLPTIAVALILSVILQPCPGAIARGGGGGPPG